jgi:hypothetical protein
MTPSPLVPVEGALARPRIHPLDDVPPFGREWRFPDASDARPGRNCVAMLTTSCIDVDRPHCACQWEPWPAATSAPAPIGTPVAPAAVAAGRWRPPARRRRDRRAMYAACWSIGALGVIGWLIGTYEPPPGFGSADAIQAAGGAPDHVTRSAGTIHVAAARPGALTGALTRAIPQRDVATPVASTSEPPPAMHRVALRPAPLHPQAAADVRHGVPASPRRATDRRTTEAPPRTQVVPRLAAHPPIVHAPRPRGATDIDAHERSGQPPRMADTRDTRDSLDDPATLIAMANALRATQPARPAHPGAASFDWTSQLSHRRVTDVPDAFAH